MTRKRRLGDVLIEKGFAKNKNDAFVIVTEGAVRVDGRKAVSPAEMIEAGTEITVRAGNGYVGRGAYKLESALQNFSVPVEGKVCADIGAATGGFTEVLLRRGARKVYAIDTARGKLAYKIRSDPRVIVMERSDVRAIEALAEKIDLAVMDVSLISLRDILPSAARLLRADGEAVALFKPQYEARDPALLSHGIVKNTEEREKLVADFRAWTHTHSWRIMGEMESPIRGTRGNTEYLFYLNILS